MDKSSNFRVSADKDSHPLQVVLGSQTIKAFVAAPKEFKVIGIVRMGMEFGLLATTSAGHYVRVNGSRVEPLHGATVDAAIQLARTSGRGESYAASRSSTPVASPSVIVRKRRRLTLETVRAVRSPMADQRLAA